MIDAMLRGFVRANLWLRYRLEIRGLDAIQPDPERSILFLPNHPALIDPVIVMSVLAKRFDPRALGDENQIDRFFIRWLARRQGIIPVPDLVASGPGARRRVEQAVGKVVDLLKDGQNMLLYPSGHAYHSRHEDLRGNSAVRTILDEIPDQRIVLLRTTGLWGSRFSRAWGVEPDVAGIVKRVPLWLAANGIVFMPRRRVQLEFVEPDDLPRDASRKQLNAWLEEFYNHQAPPAKKVPYFWWQGREPEPMAEPTGGRIQGDAARVGGSTRRIVEEHLSERTGVEQLDDQTDLAADLGMDSLARAELLVWLQDEFGFGGSDVDALRSVGDVILAAAGMGGVSHAQVPEPPKAWRPAEADPDRRLELPDGDTICQAFCNQAAGDPSRPILADQRSGMKTYRDVLTGIYALRPHIEALDGSAVGIMLPASVGATLVYLATLFAGKTPVMVNWTVGPRNIRHGLDLTGVRTILTAQQLLDRLASQGVELSDLGEAFLPLEQLRERIGLGQKIRAALRARLGVGGLRDVQPQKIAAVLFTSGSEARPKAVPLTHENILSNMRDILSAIDVRASDRLMGFLPPFHSFGLTVTSILPVCAALPTVYHADPTQSAVVANMIRAYKATLVVGTPTFLNGIARACGDRRLESLRLAVTGAEACPEYVYEAIAAACPNATVIEGYGVTECAPIVSVNDPDDPRRGTIGRALPSFRTALVDPETGQAVVRARKGMLLVRGPCVFPGYLGPEAPDPFVRHDGQSWYRTGDLVRRDDDGVLHFQGRWKRFVKIGGEMISLPAIEAVLAEHLVEPSDDDPVLAVVPTGPETQVELVLATVRDVERREVNGWIRQAGFSGLHNIRRVERVDQLPQLGTGKVDYRALQRRLAGEGD